MTRKILVSGGAGYIGSHVVRQLGEAGYDIVVYDNLSTGSAQSVLYGQLVIGSLEDTDHLYRTFSEHNFDAILHFAASISVPESVQNPLKYYANNTRNTLNLLQCAQDFNVNNIIFSSTAAVYGEPEDGPITEQSPTHPINPYGCSKLMSEQMIRDYSQASKLEYVILRYFNVAGADTSGQLGPSSKKAEHLIKVACDAVLGRRPYVGIFGTDFPTADGTGVRDYIHVEDLAAAHVDALKYLLTHHKSQTFNCGYGRGYSVQDVIEKAKEVSGVDFRTKALPRRVGDPASVVADSQKIREVIGWQPKFDTLEAMITSALNWEKQLLARTELVAK